MKVHQQFDLNLNKISPSLGKVQEKALKVPELIEQLVKNLVEEGYIVIMSSAKYMGIPKTITVVKDFTGPMVTYVSTKITDDFNSLAEGLGIRKLFD